MTLCLLKLVDLERLVFSDLRKDNTGCLFIKFFIHAIPALLLFIDFSGQLFNATHIDMPILDLASG